MYRDCNLPPCRAWCPLLKVGALRAEATCRLVGIPVANSVLLIPRAQQMHVGNMILGITWSDGDSGEWQPLKLSHCHSFIHQALTEPLLYAGHLAATHEPRAGSPLQLSSSPHLEAPALFHTVTRRRFCSSSSGTGLQSKPDSQCVSRAELQSRPTESIITANSGNNLNIQP